MHNFLLTNTVFFTTVFAEYIFHLTQKTSSHVPVGKFVAMFVILFIFSFIKNQTWRRVAHNFTLFLSFFQMMHLQFYSVPIYPNAIYLFFAEMGEVTSVLTQEFTLFFIPLIIVVPAIVINLFVDKKAFSLRSIKGLHFLFIFYIIYNPARTFVTGNTWGRQPSGEEFMGMNTYLSISYFSGRLLPAKLFRDKNKESKRPLISFEKKLPKDINIIFVLGESLTPNHMSLYGYKRETTPYLNSLKSDPNFYFFRGISSGVSTDVAVALLFNNTYGISASTDVIKGDKCLFKMAKESGFKTHFFSTQSTQQLRYIINSICPKYIDEYIDLDQFTPDIEDPNTASDLFTAKKIPTNLESTKNFYVLHQRSAHSPYNLRYPSEQTKFKLTGDYNKDRVNHYDNAVFQFDLYMEELIEKITNFTTPTLLIYVSDHGEGLGEENVWGHAVLKRPSIEVPMFFYAHKLDTLGVKHFPKNPTHLNLSLYLSQLLGFNSNLNIFEIPKDYTILANDIDGFAGYLKTEFREGELITIKREDI